MVGLIIHISYILIKIMISGNINSTYFSVYTYGGEMIIAAPEPFYVSWTPSNATGYIFYDPYSKVSLNNYSGYISFSYGEGDPPMVIFPKCTFLSVETNFTTTYSLQADFANGVGMFEFCSLLQYANLPECRSLGSYAFLDCSNLTSVSLPVCVYVAGGDFEFTPLLSISLPMCLYIGNYTFKACASLSQVYLPVCSYIGVGAFVSCSSLSSISLPSCLSIDEYAFNDCVSLQSVYLPVCLSVGRWAFQDCSSLTQVNLPMCSYIGWCAFNRCSSLSYVNLSKCTLIGDRAFANCTNLHNFIIRTSNCVLDGSSVFYNTPIASSQGGIYVPSSLVNVYKTAMYWSSLSYNIYPIP